MLFFFKTGGGRAGALRPGKRKSIRLASLARLRSASRLAISAGSPTGFLTKVSWLARGTYRIVISRETLPTHSFTEKENKWVTVTKRSTTTCE